MLRYIQKISTYSASQRGLSLLLHVNHWATHFAKRSIVQSILIAYCVSHGVCSMRYWSVSERVVTHCVFEWGLSFAYLVLLGRCRRHLRSNVQQLLSQLCEIHGWPTYQDQPMTVSIFYWPIYSIECLSGLRCKSPGAGMSVIPVAADIDTPSVCARHAYWILTHNRSHCNIQERLL